MRQDLLYLDFIATYLLTPHNSVTRFS